MNSLPTIDQLNQQKFMDLLARFDPELFLIKIALIECQVNPILIPAIIRTIGNLAIGTGFGKIQIFMQARIITQIKPEESVSLNEPASVDNLIE